MIKVESRLYQVLTIPKQFSLNIASSGASHFLLCYNKSECEAQVAGDERKTWGNMGGRKNRCKAFLFSFRAYFPQKREMCEYEGGLNKQ